MSKPHYPVELNDHPFRKRVHPIAQSIDDLRSIAGAELTDLQRDFLLVFWLMVDTELNGFEAFLQNPRGGPNLDSLPGALVRIGAPATAAILKRIADSFPPEVRSDDEGVRYHGFRGLDPERKQLAYDFEKYVYKHEEDLMLCLCNFAQRHEHELPHEATGQSIRSRAQAQAQEREERITALNAMWSRKNRTCPRCGTNFRSVQNKGACPQCRHQFLASHPDNPGDWPMGTAKTPE